MLVSYLVKFNKRLEARARRDRTLGGSYPPLVINKLNQIEIIGIFKEWFLHCLRRDLHLMNKLLLQYLTTHPHTFLLVSITLLACLDNIKNKKLFL